MKLALDTVVNVDLPSLKGYGLIKGISTEMAVAGCIYIVEMVSGNAIPNETYPYTHIAVPESYLIVAANNKELRA